MESKGQEINLLIKIYSPQGTDFYTEHKELIEKNGYVWFCRFGKNNMKIETMQQCSTKLFIKESKNNGDRLYVATFTNIQKKIPDNEVSFPTYYKDIKLDKGCWIKIKNLEQVSVESLISQYTTSSGGSIKGILRSMCTACYIKKQGTE